MPMNYEKKAKKAEDKAKWYAQKASEERQKAKDSQKKARAHRLIERGAMLEAFLREPLLLSNDDVKYILESLFADDRVQRALDRLISKRKVPDESGAVVDEEASETKESAEETEIVESTLY